jgi:hypothetical protein
MEINCSNKKDENNLKFNGIVNARSYGCKSCNIQGRRKKLLISNEFIMMVNIWTALLM